MTLPCYRYAFLLLFCAANACKDAHSRQSIVLSHPSRFSDTAACVILIDSFRTFDASMVDENSTVTGSLYDSYRGDLLYYLYNRSLKKLDIFSLTAKRYLKSILLAKGDMASVGELQALFCHTTDSIFLLDEAFIQLIDSNGSVKKRWPINERAMKTQAFFEKYAFYTRPPSIFYYDRARQSIYVQSYDRREFSPKRGFDSKEGFSHSGFMASFDLATKQANILPVAYPTQYNTGYYGNMLQPSVEFLQSAQSDIAYIFPISPAVFTQDLNRDTVNEYNCPSSLTSNSIKPLSWADMNDEDLKVRHFHKNVNFFRLLHTDSPTCYYRFHYDKMDSSNNDFQNVYAKKSLVLTALDAHFAICKELSMPVRNIHPIAAFSAHGVVYIPMVDPLRRRRSFLQFLTIKQTKK